MVRPGREAFGRLVGSDYDEQVHGTCLPTCVLFAS